MCVCVLDVIPLTDIYCNNVVAKYLSQISTFASLTNVKSCQAHVSCPLAPSAFAMAMKHQKCVLYCLRLSILSQGSKVLHIHTSICTNRKCGLVQPCLLLLICTEKIKDLIAWNLVTVMNNLYSMFNFLNNETSLPPWRLHRETIFLHNWGSRLFCRIAEVVSSLLLQFVF